MRHALSHMQRLGKLSQTRYHFRSGCVQNPPDISCLKHPWDVDTELLHPSANTKWLSVTMLWGLLVVSAYRFSCLLLSSVGHSRELSCITQWHQHYVKLWRVWSKQPSMKYRDLWHYNWLGGVVVLHYCRNAYVITSSISSSLSWTFSKHRS